MFRGNRHTYNFRNVPRCLGSPEPPSVPGQFFLLTSTSYYAILYRNWTEATRNLAEAKTQGGKGF
jgi:hypothetical protein